MVDTSLPAGRGGGTSDPALPAVAARAGVPGLLARLLAGLLAGLLLFDVALGRLDARRDLSDEPMHQPDPELGWTNLPGFRNAMTTISSLGLRSPEIPADAPHAELRILGVGASTVYGAGRGGPDMHHTWSAFLEADCARRFGGDWRVLNGGVMGYSAVQAARRAIRLLPEVQPDLVLLFLAPGSQALLDWSSARHYVHAGGRLLPLDIARALPGPLLPAAAALHAALGHSAIYTRYRARASDTGRRPPEISRFVLSRAPAGPLVEPLLQRTWDELAALADAARAQGAELRVVLHYEPFMDSPGAWAAYLRTHAASGAPPPGTPREEPLDRLREECARRGIATWSMADVLTQIGSDHARYTCDDAHWSAEGHALVAGGLAERLAADDGGTPREPGTLADGGLLERLRRARADRPRD
ncbi:MAG: hypothetical protein FJ296_05720 [Planctomycetes bacterium]|nr:hypothetical protein [Planctomycetota bacterium]